MKNTEHQPQDDGLELLKRVIETNEKHIEESVKLNFLYEDFLSLLGKYELSFRGTTYSQGEVKRLMKEEKEERIRFLEMLEATKMNLSKQSIDRLDQFEIQLKGLKNRFNGSIGVLILPIVVLVITSFSAKYWFSESVRTKMEIREELLKEIYSEGKRIYERTYVDDLENNTNLINKWIEKKPREAQNFLHFKSGYDSK